MGYEWAVLSRSIFASREWGSGEARGTVARYKKILRSPTRLPTSRRPNVGGGRIKHGPRLAAPRKEARRSASAIRPNAVPPERKSHNSCCRRPPNLRPVGLQQSRCCLLHNAGRHRAHALTTVVPPLQSATLARSHLRAAKTWQVNDQGRPLPRAKPAQSKIAELTFRPPGVHSTTRRRTRSVRVPRPRSSSFLPLQTRGVRVRRLKPSAKAALALPALRKEH